VTALPDVLESARYVVDRARFVSIDPGAVQQWADAQRGGAFEVPALPPELRFTGSRDDSANLILLLDCLNFCFWSDEPWSVDYRGQTWTRTYAMYAGVMRAVEQDAHWLAAERWADASERDLANVFAGEGKIPLLAQRREVLNETGRCLVEAFQGRSLKAVEEAGRHARGLAYLLADRFPSFRDVAEYKGRTVALLKRAQICAADLHECWTRQGDEGLASLEELTVFADYRLPQYLRHVGVMRLSPELEARIDQLEEIDAGSEEEIELRAATIVAGNLLIRAIRGRGQPLTACQLDYVLWERSHDQDVTTPHHRTRTIYY
jgi:hypothetical protein